MNVRSIWRYSTYVEKLEEARKRYMVQNAIKGLCEAVGAWHQQYVDSLSRLALLSLRNVGIEASVQDGVEGVILSFETVTDLVHLIQGMTVRV